MEFTAHDPLAPAGKGTTRVSDYSSTLLRPSRSRQLRRRSGVPTEVGSPESGFDSEEVLNGGGFGVDRPLLVPFVAPPEEVVPPTRLRVGVRRMPVPLLPLEGALEGASRFGPLSTGAPASARSAVLLAAGLRVREPVPPDPPDPEPEAAGRRVRLAAEAGFRELDRREVAALVAALSSPFGDAASSETSGREDAEARDRDCARVIHSPVKYVLLNLTTTSATRPDSADMFISNAATSTCLPTSLTACRAG